MTFKTSNPVAEFKRLVKGSSIITPQVICYGFTKCGTGVFEIAKGSGIDGRPLFGVSIRDSSGESIGGDLFERERDAIDYVDTWTAERSAS